MQGGQNLFRYIALLLELVKEWARAAVKVREIDEGAWDGGADISSVRVPNRIYPFFLI